MSVLYEKDCNILAFFIGEYTDAKKVNEKLAYSQKSETNYYQEVMLVSEGSFCYRANGLIWSNTLLVEY